jgi:stress-induced morphogen
MAAEKRLAKCNSRIFPSLEIIARSSHHLPNFFLRHAMAVNVRLAGLRIRIESEFHKNPLYGHNSQDLYSFVIVSSKFKITSAVAV